MTFTPPEDQIDAELARVLDSRSFSRAARQRTLLGYLVNARRAGEGARLKESTIALDVFGRDAATYDSAVDGIVRVSVNRLRDLLDRYYENEGSRDSLRFEIQRGGYVPIIRRASPDSLPPTPRLAVLPLANFTGKEENEALCDGLTDDLIDALAQIDDVRVIARTSSFKYKGQSLDIRQIATDLSVDAILEGSVQLIGDHIRLSAQMILGVDGTHLWSHAFEVDASDRDLLQRELIALMHRSLKASTAKRKAPGSIAPSIESLQPLEGSAIPEAAIVAFHRALFAYRKDTITGYLDAERALEQAITLAPAFARAHAMRARVLWAIGNSGSRPLHDCATAALRSTAQAIKLAPRDPYVLSAHGYLEFFVNYNPSAAFACSTLAIKTGPNVIEAHLFHAKICTYTRRVAEAEASLATARALDPLSLDPLHGRIALAIVGHEYPLALDLLDQLLSIEPGSSIACWNRGHVLRKLGRYDDCDRNLADTIARWPESEKYTTLIRALNRASAGELDEARTLRGAALTEVPWDEDPMVYAVVDALLGERGEVYRAWRHSITRHDPYVYMSYYYEEFDAYRSEPEFQRVAAALNL